MGLGIGKDCKVCGEQLQYGIGFDSNTEDICNPCKEKIPKVLAYLAQKEEEE